MQPKAIIGSAIGAILGALIWGGITYGTNTEFGIIAWGVGGLVGFGAMAGGGEGNSTAAICAVFAVVAIVGGKYLAITFALPGQIEEYAKEELADQLSRTTYTELVADAEAFTDVTPGDYAEYMIERGYTDAEYPSEVPEEQIEAFTEYSVPELEGLSGSPPPTFDEWQQGKLDEFTEIVSQEINMVEAIQMSFSFWDVLWILFGVSTAWRMGAGRESTA